jgi:hypothetical protein
MKVFKDPVKAREAAVNAMEMTMVNYDRSERPLMYQNLGVAGEALSPFAVFRNAYIGNTILAIKAAKAGHPSTWKPIVAMASTYLALAGAAGVVGMGEYDLVIDFLRYIFPQYVDEIPPKSNELFAKLPEGFMGDSLRFGLLSASTGVNMGASMAAVAFDDMTNIALVDFMKGLYDLAGVSAKEGMEAFGVGTGASSRDIMEASSKIAPSIVKPWIELSQTRNPYVKSMATSPKAVTERTMDEFAAEAIWGKPALSTQSRVTAINSDKEIQSLKINASKKIVEKVVDGMRKGTGSLSTAEAYRGWVDLTDGTPQEFQDAIKAQMEDTYVTYMKGLLNSKKMNAQKRFTDVYEKGGMRQ